MSDSKEMTIVNPGSMPVVFQSVRGLDFEAINKKLDDELPDFPQLFPGDAIVFDGKRAQWKYGHGKKGVPFDHTAVSFVMNVPNAVEGFQRFIDDGNGKQRPMIPVMVPICDPTKRLPDRDTLGDNDPTKWPTDNFGKTPDPWKRFIAIPVRIDGQEQINHVFVTTISALIAAKGLIKQFVEQGRSNLGKLPVVNVGKSVRTRKDENGRESEYDIPTFEIVGWDDPIAADEPDASQTAAANAPIPEATVTTQARTTVEKLQAEANASAAAEIQQTAKTVEGIAANLSAPSRRRPPATETPSKPAAGSGLFVGGGGRRTKVNA